MYESPVNFIYGEMQTQIEGDIFKAIQNVGIDVNEEEIIKALRYDREQYSKGYSDGYAKAIDDCLSALYRNVGKFISTELYYKVYETVERLKGSV